jgi:hypothetical protein
VLPLFLLFSGFGGQKFIESQVKKIRDLKNMCLERVGTHNCLRDQPHCVGIDAVHPWVCAVLLQHTGCAYQLAVAGIARPYTAMWGLG